MIDTTQRLEIEGSPRKYFAFGLLGILMTLGSAAVAFSIGEPGSFGQFVGYAGLILFGLCTVLLFWRALTSSGPVVTIAPEGIRDLRVAAEFIPWAAIRNVATWTFQGQKVMVLAVDPAIEDRLTLTRIAKWTRSANAKLNADGLCVTAQGLKMDFQTLLDTTIAYAAAAEARMQTQPESPAAAQ